MAVIKKVFTSLLALTILLIAKSVIAQLELQASEGGASLDGNLGASTTIGMTTADSLMERILVGYSDSVSFHSEPPMPWHFGENVMAVVPMGWEVGFQARQGNHEIIEFVSEGQTVYNWQNLLTMEIVFGGLSKSPREVFEEAATLIERFCPDVDVSSVLTGEENGYPFALWIQNCPNNLQVNQAEITLLKVIEGNDSFYFVHRAWRIPPLSPNQSIPIDTVELEEWGRYMSLVGVCDTRIPERNCPSHYRENPHAEDED